MCVTIYTDAGCKNKKSTWAIWSRCEEGRIVESGSCLKYIMSANAAEIYAIYKGIQLVTRKWNDLEGIDIRTNSKHAISRLKFGISYTGNFTVFEKRARENLYKFLDKKNIKLKMRWVKGHQGNNSTPAWLNNKCDELTKKARGE